MKRRTLVSLSLLAAASCTGRAPSQAPSVCPTTPPSAYERLAPVPVQRHRGSPNVTLVAREGDPRPAVALVVATRGGSFSSAALAAVVEARMGPQGPATETRADGHGFRVLLAIDDPIDVSVPLNCRMKGDAPGPADGA